MSTESRHISRIIVAILFTSSSSQPHAVTFSFLLKFFYCGYRVRYSCLSFYTDLQRFPPLLQSQLSAIGIDCHSLKFLLKSELKTRTPSRLQLAWILSSAYYPKIFPFLPILFTFMSLASVSAKLRRHALKSKNLHTVFQEQRKDDIVGILCCL